MTLYGAVHIRYRKAIGDWKDIGNDFNANDSPNDYLESEFQKDSESRTRLAWLLHRLQEMFEAVSCQTGKTKRLHPGSPLKPTRQRLDGQWS